MPANVFRSAAESTFKSANRNDSRQNNQPNFVTSNLETKYLCKFCNKQHASSTCRAFADIKAIKECLLQIYRCTKCTRHGHHSETYTVNLYCAGCKTNSHHPFLCNKERSDVITYLINIESSQQIQDTNNEIGKSTPYAPITQQLLINNSSTQINSLGSTDILIGGDQIWHF